MIGTVYRNAAGIRDLFEHALHSAFWKHPVVRRQCPLGGAQDQNRASDPGIEIRRVDLLEIFDLFPNVFRPHARPHAVGNLFDFITEIAFQGL